MCALRNECRIPTLIDASDSVELAVRTCRHYLLPIGFQKEVGLDSFFNTIRLGDKWARRFAEETEGGKELIVGLVNAKKGTLIGKAKVAWVRTGSLESIAVNHGPDNHTVLELPEQDAIESVRSTLKKIYKLQMSPDSIFSAIYMERINE